MEQTILDSEHTCQICLSEGSESIITALCHPSHIFCEECYRDWIRMELRNTANTHVQCPTCRENILTRTEGHAILGRTMRTEMVVSPHGYTTENSYLDGILHGLSRTISPAGKVLIETNYEEGLLSGVCRNWIYSDHEDLIFYMENSYHGGILHGISRSWTEADVLIYEAEHEGGIMHGWTRYWNPEGQLTAEHFFQNGHLLRSTCSPGVSQG
jgi:hypothetical protein